jgi:hypothetical protein
MPRTQVADFVELKDPDGYPLALSYGFEIGKEPVRYTRELNLTGLGHVLLTVKDTQRSHDFYTGVLGFRLSDWVCIDDHIRISACVSCAATRVITTLLSHHVCRVSLPGCNM